MLQGSSKAQTEKLLERRKTAENGDKEEVFSFINFQENYIFYNNKRKFTSKIELDIILNSNPNHRVLILIDTKYPHFYK